ncbi:MAG TPA: hypothetical protein VGN14_03175 [Candidatus Elarobacter sp.]
MIPVAIAVLTIAAAGCANSASTDPAVMTDRTTRAVYDGDLNGTTAYFDDALKTQVTRSSVGQLSDQMHALGTYHGLKPVSSQPDQGRYIYQAAFDKGSIEVRVRLDPQQRLAAYRIVPQSG